MLGLLGASFVMGLLLILILRQMDANPSGLSIKEIVAGVFFVVPLIIAGVVAGAISFLISLGLENGLTVLNYQVSNLALLGAALGGALGFLGMYTYMAATGKGWRWLWLSWFTLGALAIVFMVALNLRGLGFDSYLDPVRQLPYVDRLSNVIETEGTGKVRILIWDAAMELVAPHALAITTS